MKPSILATCLLALTASAQAIAPPPPPPDPADRVIARVVEAGNRHKALLNLTLAMPAGEDEGSRYWSRETPGWLVSSGYTTGGGEGCDNCPGIWRWASLTKQLVAVLAMQEVEAGRLALDAPIGRYLTRERRTRLGLVTLRQLLQHTSGVVDAESGAKNASGFPVRYLRSAAIVANDGLCHGQQGKPGAFRYNNCDYELVGEVLETLTGKKLASLLAERITMPLGMTTARLLASGEPAGQPGYLDGRPDDWIDVGRFGAAGAVAGRWTEPVLFDIALLQGKLLRRDTLAELWRGDPRLGYAALGAWSFPAKLEGCEGPVQIVERHGEIGGVQVRNFILPDRRIALVAFTTRPADFGQVWQGKGLSFDLLSAAACPARP